MNFRANREKKKFIFYSEVQSKVYKTKFYEHT